MTLKFVRVADNGGRSPSGGATPDEIGRRVVTTSEPTVTWVTGQVLSIDWWDEPDVARDRPAEPPMASVAPHPSW